MSDDALHFDLYQHADPLAAEWLESLLRYLWEKGLRFDEGSDPGATSWEEALQRSVAGYSTYSEARRSMEEFRGPLSTLIQHVQHSGGVFQLYDRGLLLYLKFEDTFVPGTSIALSDSERLRLINLSTVTGGQQAWSYRYSPSITQAMSDTTSALLLSYQQVMVSFCYWVEQICAFVAPLYGFGYNPERDLSENVDQEEQERSVISNMLLNNTLPNLQETLQMDEWLVYARSTLLSPKHIDSWLANPNATLKRLSSGGYLCYTPPAPYRYDQGIGFDYYYRGQAAQEQGNMTDASAYYERAITIFTAIGANEFKNLAESHLFHLRSLESRKQR